MERRNRLVAGLAGTVAVATGLVVMPGGVPATAVPAGFTDTLVTNVSGPTEVDWTPDGRMLITGKSGQLRVFDDGQLLATPALNLGTRVCTNGERGLVGLAVHPQFGQNHYVYLYYTYNKFANSCPESIVDGPVNRLSRFVLPDSNVIDPGSETVLFETPPMYRDHHTAGDVKFGKDGHVYVTVGDSGAQSLGWPQDPGKLAGKIVRVTDSGGIPAGNPFTGPGTARCNVGGVPPAGSAAGTKCQEVFSLGFRNPFRFAHDPNASGVRYFVNDVGQHSWEEISEGPVAGGDYGWPVREGPCAKDSTTDCGPAPSGMLDPAHWYQHGPDGAAATAGAFVPNGVWPAEYDGDYLFADYVFGTISRLRPGGARCLSCAPPTSGWSTTLFSPVAQVVSMRFGPYQGTQALYYVSRDNSQVRRIAYSGSVNRAPQAAADAAPTSGPVPLAVTFDASRSSDPDGDALTYAWDFQGDGTVDSTSVSTGHTYTTPGTRTATLTVRDPSGAQDTVTVQIDAGNSAPTPVIETPADGTTFAVGDRLVLHGSATDPEDGALADSSLSWEVLRHHATHTHPFLEPTSGNDVAITAPEPEDLDAAKDSYLMVHLTATDSAGVTSTTSRRLDPKFVDLTFETAPAGLRLDVGGESITGGTTVRSWENYALLASAPDQTDASGRTWVFDSWSDGGVRQHAITTPATAASYTATFVEGQAPEPVERTFTAVADTYVDASQATRSFGTRSTLRTDASPEILSYLRFDLSGLGSDVSDARLRVYTNTGNRVGLDASALTSNAWNESTTYADRPGLGALLGSSGRVSAGTWVEIPLAATQLRNGTFDLAVSSTHTTATSLASREAGANAPQLVVLSGAGPDDTTAPSVPTGLAAGPVSSSQVTLSWDAATDDVGVTGYEVFRDDVSLAEIGTTTGYVDQTVSPQTSYEYRVRARDAAGNWSGLSGPVPVTTPPAGGGGGILVLTPTDDAGIREASPGTNYGTSASLEVDNSPVKHTLLKFDLAGVDLSTVTSARLRLAVVDSSSDGGTVWRAAGSAWSQGTVTWTSAPAVDAAIAGVPIGAVSSGTVTDVDIRRLLVAGAQTLRITSSASNGADYSSKEGAVAPQLVLDLG